MSIASLLIIIGGIVIYTRHRKKVSEIHLRKLRRNRKAQLALLKAQKAKEALSKETPSKTAPDTQNLAED